MSAAADAGERPPVTLPEAHDDWGWFSRGRRRYRVRQASNGGWWIVRRRRAGLYLRCWAATLPKAIPDNDEAIRPYWFLAAWPELPAAKRAELIKEARKLEGGGG